MKINRLLLVLPAVLVLGVTACGNRGETTSSIDTTTSETEQTTSSTESGGQTSSSEQEYTPIITEPVTIDFWSTFSYTTQLDNIISAFNELEPNITVNNVKQSGGYDDLKTKTIQGFPTNNYPDIVVAYPDHVAEYLDYNKAVDMTPYIDNATYGWTAEDKADVLPSFQTEGTQYSIPGTYSLPLAKSTEAMFYNEDVLIGLDLSSVDSTINNGSPLTASYINSLTWEELFNKLCPAIVAYDAALPEGEKIIKVGTGDGETATYHAVMGYDSDDNLFITLAEQYGYDYTAIDPVTGVGQILFNNDDMKGLMKVFNQAYKDGYFITKGSAGNNYVNTYFTEQKVLFSIGSTGGVKYQISDDNPMNVGVARIPQAEGRDPKLINQGPSVCMLNHNDENRILASWLFYKFLTNEENSLYWSLETGYMPIRYSGYESDDYLDYADASQYPEKSLERLTANNAAYVGTVTDYLFTSPVFKGSSSARQAAASVMTTCLTTANLTDDVLDDIFQKAVDDVLLDM